ncbi:MAG: hypothetical protein PVSMB1_17310 [Gemmatimonadaceae bacterium]
MTTVVHATAESILANLKIVDGERRRRARQPGLTRAVDGVKAFQQRRFATTYADLLASARYGSASRFFLDDLYGPSDFTRRDAQFARVVPALVRLFPDEVVQTVGTLAQLHALSEVLDTAMGAAWHGSRVVEAQDYIRIWQATGRASDRQVQIDLTLGVAARLDAFTRKPLLRSSLRLMRGPARAAGMTELQQFLERGFDTFRAMKGADEFIATVRQRELALASSLFQADLDVSPPTMVTERALESLPNDASANP